MRFFLVLASVSFTSVGVDRRRSNVSETTISNSINFGLNDRPVGAGLFGRKFFGTSWSDGLGTTDIGW